MKIIATRIKAKDLKPGDLFSTADQSYFDFSTTKEEVIGEKVYIRTETPCPKDQEDLDIYKVSIVP
jgi:hypothetical protein